MNEQKLIDKYFTQDGKPRCATCGEAMKKTDTSTWKLDCECVKKEPQLKNLRVAIL